MKFICLFRRNIGSIITLFYFVFAWYLAGLLNCCKEEVSTPPPSPQPPAATKPSRPSDVSEERYLLFDYKKGGGYSGGIHEHLVAGTNKDEVTRSAFPSDRESVVYDASVSQAEIDARRPKAYVVRPEQVPEILKLLYDNDVLSLPDKKPKATLDDQYVFWLSFTSSHYSHNAIAVYDGLHDMGGNPSRATFERLVTLLRPYLHANATEIRQD